MPHSVNKGFPLLHTSGIVAKAQTVIVQLDYINDKLLVSTMTKTAIVDLKRFAHQRIGLHFFVAHLFVHVHRRVIK